MTHKVVICHKTKQTMKKSGMADYIWRKKSTHYPIKDCFVLKSQPSRWVWLSTDSLLYMNCHPLLGKKIVWFRILYLEKRFFLSLERLPPKASEFDLLYILTHSWGKKRQVHVFFKDIAQNLKLALQFHFLHWYLVHYLHILPGIKSRSMNC